MEAVVHSAWVAIAIVHALGAAKGAIEHAQVVVKQGAIKPVVQVVVAALHVIVHVVLLVIMIAIRPVVQVEEVVHLVVVAVLVDALIHAVRHAIIIAQDHVAHRVFWDVYHHVNYPVQDHAI